MNEKEENANAINIFISGLPECEDEIKIILKEFEKYDYEDYFEQYSIVGNSYVKSLLSKNSSLYKKKEKIDIITDDEDISFFIGLIDKKTTDSKYPDINLEKNYSELMETDGIYYIILVKDYDNIEIDEFKEKLDETFEIDEYDDIEEFKIIVKEEVKEWVDFINELMEEVENMMKSMFRNLDQFDSEDEDDPEELLEKVIRKGMGLNDDEASDEVSEEMKKFMESFEYDDELSDEELDPISIETDEMFNLLKENYTIDEDTFNRENIIENFEEYSLVSLMEMGNFMTYESEDNFRELYNSATIFSKKLDTLLKLFDERVINSPDFIKIKEKDEDFIEKIKNDDDFSVFELVESLKEIKPTFETMIIYMKGLSEVSREKKSGYDEYDALLSEFVANLQATFKNFQLIEETIKTIENV